MYTQPHSVTYYFYPLLEGLIAQSPHAPSFSALLDAPPPERPALLYIHIPYCHDLCRFCPFHVRVKSGEEVYNRYTQAICREMELLASRRYPAELDIAAVYFGGGSPSILPVENLRQLFDAMRQRFRIRGDAELSFEGEPRTLSDEARLDLLREFGFQRVSFGLQTYDPAQRERFNIAATLDDVERVTRNARARGFADINVDMMYDLPGQTVAMLRQDLARLADAGYDSVDYYNLHYFAFPNSFKAAMESGEIPPKPDQDTHFALFAELRESLRAYGYHYVADQIFSKRDALCEYFRLLWGGGHGQHDAETVAVGASARGYLGGFSYMNESDTATYLAQVEAGKLPLQKLSLPLRVPENRGAAFMTKFFTLDKTKHAKAVESVPAPVWARLLEWGLVADDGDRLRLTERGQLWTASLMLDLFEDEQRDIAYRSLGFLTLKPGARTGSF